jgi:hypothetical protein
MNKIESSVGVGESIPKWNGGDLEIPLENLLAEQQLLMRLMVPKRIAELVTESNGEDIGIEDALFERWYVKYSKLFREYCNDLDPSNDYENGLIPRVVAGTLTSEDYSILQKHLEDPINLNEAEGIGGQFFKDDEEVQDFLKQYVH